MSFARLMGCVLRVESVLPFVLVVLLAASGASAQIYRWTDAGGQLHFAQDLNQVPAEHRAAAEAGAATGGSAGRSIQVYPTAPASADSSAGRPAARSARRARSAARRAEQTYRIPVERAGTAMLVQVRLNDSVTALFHIDTGASDVVIPKSVADELGLELAGARTGIYGTANGIVEQTLVTLDSVDLAGARAERVPATVSPSMSHGLLGLSFFNHFRYHIDPAAGIVTLTPNGMVESGLIKAGRSEAQWRAEFAQLAARQTAIERELERINPNWTVRRDELEQLIEENERQRSVLDAEADHAQVPMAWRD